MPCPRGGRYRTSAELCARELTRKRIRRGYLAEMTHTDGQTLNYAGPPPPRHADPRRMFMYLCRRRSASARSSARG